jgi:hypothetical protein
MSSSLKLYKIRHRGSWVFCSKFFYLKWEAVLENQKKYKEIIENAQKRLEHVQDDIEKYGHLVSEESLQLLESGASRCKVEIKEASLFLRYVDYQ